MAQSPAGSVALGELPSVFLSEEIPLFAGAFTQSLLVGVMLCQLVHYSNSSWATDRVLTRAFVSLIVVIVLLKFGSEVANVEYQLVRNFDVLQTPVLVKVGLICSFFPILLAQLWLLERTHRITLNTKVTAVGAVLILLSAVAFVGEIVARLRTMANEEGVFAIRLWITLYAVATSVSTSFTSVAISWSLYQSRSTASNVRLIALLTGSIVASIEACIPACLGSIGMALSALIAPHTLWYAAFQMNLCVLYAMSVLFVLNSRVRIAMQADEQEFKNSNSLAAMQEAGRCAPRGRRATFGRVTIDYAVDVEVKVEQGEKEELPPFFPGLVDESVSVSAPTDPRLYHENFDRGFDA